MADSVDGRRKKEPPRRLGGMKVGPPAKDTSKEALLDAYQQASPEERKKLREYMGHVRRKQVKEA